MVLILSFFSWWTTLTHTGLLLVLHLRNTPGGASLTIWDPWDQTRFNHIQGKCSIYCSITGPNAIYILSLFDIEPTKLLMWYLNCASQYQGPEVI